LSLWVFIFLRLLRSGRRHSDGAVHSLSTSWHRKRGARDEKSSGSWRRRHALLSSRVAPAGLTKNKKQKKEKGKRKMEKGKWKMEKEEKQKREKRKESE